MSLTDAAESEPESPSRSQAEPVPAFEAHDAGDDTRREAAEAAAYDFDDSTPAFRVVAGSEARPTGFLLRAEDENAARRQLMVAAIRLGFDRTGEDLGLVRVDADADADAAEAAAR